MRNDWTADMYGRRLICELCCEQIAGETMDRLRQTDWQRYFPESVIASCNRMFAHFLQSNYLLKIAMAGLWKSRWVKMPFQLLIFCTRILLGLTRIVCVIAFIIIAIWLFPGHESIAQKRKRLLDEAFNARKRADLNWEELQQEYFLDKRECLQDYKDAVQVFLCELEELKYESKREDPAKYKDEEELLYEAREKGYKASFDKELLDQQFELDLLYDADCDLQYKTDTNVRYGQIAASRSTTAPHKILVNLECAMDTAPIGRVR